MRHIQLIIVLFFSTLAYGQVDIDSVYTNIIDNIERDVDSILTDITSHRYYEEEDLIPRLNPFFEKIGKKSISTDTTLAEAYRLIVWGGINKIIVEIKKFDDIYLIVADSLSMYNDTLFRDTISQYNIDQIDDLRKSCLSLIDCEREEYHDPMMFDDRDVWIIEFFINRKYKVILRMDPEKEIKNVYHQILKIGNFPLIQFYNE